MERVILTPAERRPAILDAIAAAQSKVRLSMFRCTDFRVMDALAAAQQRGVAVKLLLTQRAKGWEKKIRELGQYLESMGAEVHRYGLAGTKYHAKYLVVDDCLALISSANLTLRYFEKTSDFILETRDAGVVANLIRLFEADTATPGVPLPADWNRRLIVGPDVSRTEFVARIAAAQKSMRIVDHRVKDPQMLALLRERERAGVKIAVYGKKSIPGLKSHGKMMLIDGAYAILGSISLSPPALGNRRELSVGVDDSGCLSVLDQFLRAAGPGMPLASLKQYSAATAEMDDDEDDDEEKESDED
ncbi:MAG: hypothetical protein FJW31_04365 [Acidobacteria bacterium]|nr:hypothetical protein [Acidobacteriota bacterium]